MRKNQSTRTTRRKRGKPSPSRLHPSRPPRSRAIFAILGVLTLLLIVGAGGTLYAAHLENSDSFCTSCHTEPESTFYQRTQAANTTDLASAHSLKGVHCIQCHSGDGVMGRIDGMKLGVRDLSVYLQGNYPQPSALTHPYGDVQCVKCHDNIYQDRSFNNHFHKLLPQLTKAFPGQRITCIECHQGHSTKGEQKLAYLNRDTTGQVCQKCHRVAGEGEEGEGRR
ncbi:MAG: hypothetical protein GXP41_12655 [Chloroflexi bacterium]|nr:hypothetical protein [Chloroflexota bacterium]